MVTFASNPSEHNQPRAIAAAICMAVIGIGFFLGMPVIVGAWSQQIGINNQQAGWLASADTAGLVLASLVVAQIVNKFSRKRLAAFGILIATSANMIAIGMDAFSSLLIIRFLAGVGGGVLYSLGLAALAATRNTGRNYAILMFAQVSVGIVIINLYTWVIEIAGISGIYISMGMAFLVAGLFIPWLPAKAPRLTQKMHDTHNSLEPKLSLTPWLCLIAFFAFYLTIGSFWAYIERIGTSAGLEGSYIAGTLSYTQVFSLPSCILAAWLCRRVGELRPLIVSLIAGATAIFALSLGVDKWSYVVVLAIFFLVWNAIDIYQLGVLSKIDHSGRYVAMVPAFQGAANALGPAAGAMLFGANNNYHLLLVMASFVMLVAAAIYIFIYFKLNTISSETAAPF